VWQQNLRNQMQKGRMRILEKKVLRNIPVHKKFRSFEPHTLAFLVKIRTYIVAIPFNLPSGHWLLSP
jgi:hypothetical protein